MPLPDAKDPFTIVHRAIWDAMAKFQDLCPGVVKADNFIRFDTGLIAPPKLGVLPGGASDAPYMALLQGAFALSQSANSLAVGVRQSYPLVIAAQDLNVVPVNLITWQTFRALVSAGSSLGLPRLVRNWTITNGMDDALNGKPEWRRGTNRWIIGLTVQVEMFVAKSDVAAGVVPTT